MWWNNLTFTCKKVKIHITVYTKLTKNRSYTQMLKNYRTSRKKIGIYFCDLGMQKFL